MPRCKECDEVLDDHEVDIHLHDHHSDIVDNLLMEYIGDAKKDAREELIDEGDE